ncbi:helix-turn-helix domain-containing protein [bacterium]|nr:helix-turn-helix domain-containing protein [bacterium]MCI0603375.1 helix-turn-helix domain-containing protein [bacterium]
MDIAELIRARLETLGYEQKELAAALSVTPSFISQLLKRKKSPPSPSRTDIYRKMEKFLKLGAGDLSKLADLQHKQELKRKFDYPTVPLFGEVRELILRKCVPVKRNEMHHIFEKEPFGEIERIITQKLLDVAKDMTKQAWNNETWLRLVARANHKSYEEMRVIVLEFLDSDIFNLSSQNAIYFLRPLIQSWDIDLVTLEMTIVLSFSQGEERLKRFAFVEIESNGSVEEPGLKDFLSDQSLSKNITEEEVKFLKQLKFHEKRPNAFYYYRELQNLRDPLHFHAKKVKR